MADNAVVAGKAAVAAVAAEPAAAVADTAVVAGKAAAAAVAAESAAAEVVPGTSAAADVVVTLDGHP